MAYFDEADASVEYASLRIASRKQMRTAGAEEVVSPTLPLLKPRGEFYKESELSCVTAVHKKKIVWEDNKVLVKLLECKKCEPCEVVLKIRET
ncbi:uncharacterized protein MONOS_18185 [Monocercomonoides exilis]|uniref:uncharacterized protein n=1 Tax=Monocercomonoides exilis TaxID=2049356 RepID=UPI00355A6B4C|nr:hypothetical protein MONOS_18185 [Monocercomonoides exilis]